MGLLIAILVLLWCLGVLIYHAINWIEKVYKRLIASSNNGPLNQEPIIQPVVKEKIVYEHSEEYKKSFTGHMIQMVETSIYNRTGRMVKVPWPETNKDKEKLEAMYKTVLDNIGK